MLWTIAVILLVPVAARDHHFVHGWRGDPSPAGDRHRGHRVPVHERPPVRLTAPPTPCAVGAAGAPRERALRRKRVPDGHHDKAVQVARGLAGVKSVKNDMRLK